MKSRTVVLRYEKIGRWLCAGRIGGPATWSVHLEAILQLSTGHESEQLTLPWDDCFCLLCAYGPSLKSDRLSSSTASLSALGLESQ